jgi:sugar (pentulose or hexulose) kinase
MQIKADVSGCRLEVPAMPEATLLGAALLAGVGTGVSLLSGFPDEPVSGKLGLHPRR